MRTILCTFFTLLSLSVLAEPILPLTKQEKELVIKEAANIPDSVDQKFEGLFNAWKMNWQTNPIARVSSTTAVTRELDEYQKLMDFGPMIIPLILKKMMADVDGNFIGLILYDDLQKNPKLKIQGLMSEQDRVVLTIRRWVNSIK